ncbi:MAG: hypothetical protein ABIQ90_01435 [Polaromonas sp.]
MFLLFEEWGWEPLAAGFAALGRLPLWRQLERLITRLPPWAALLAFGVPMLALIPLKLLALYLFGQGRAGTGLVLLVAAKIAGTALAARLFQLTQPALMRIPWFARIYTPWKIWKDQMLRQVRCSWPWRLGRRLRHRAHLLLQRLLAAFRSAISNFRK